MQKAAITPSAITSIRIATLPFLLYFLNEGDSTLFLMLFLFASLTDVVDGYAARKLKSASRTGAYYDATTDFLIITSIFALLVTKGLYPLWILAIIIFSFALFIITGLRRTQIYDPVGKYFGGLLYIIIPMTIIFPTEALCLLAQQVVTVFFAVSLTGRILYLYLNRRKGVLRTLPQNKDREVSLS